jgi:hypothetical protein
LLNLQQDPRRCKADLTLANEKLGRKEEELSKKRKVAAARKVVVEALRRQQRERSKQEESRVFLRGKITRLAEKLDGQAGAEAAQLGRRRRKARVLNPSRRAVKNRNAKVRDALTDALGKIKDAVGMGENSEEDEKRALGAVANALAVKSGKKRITAHPELIVPERIGQKFRDEGEKAVVKWMHNPARWCKMMDLGEISFRRADKLSIAFPKGAKPSNKDIIHEKKVLNHVMQEINPITPTPGGNGHQFNLSTAIGLAIPLWMDEMSKAKVSLRVD